MNERENELEPQLPSQDHLQAEEDSNVEKGNTESASAASLRYEADEDSGSSPALHDTPVSEQSEATANHDASTTPDAAPSTAEAEQAATGADDGDRSAHEPRDESAEQPRHCEGCPAHQGEDADAQPRRVVLEAGKDEESLKALALCREKVTQMHLRMHPLAARWESDRHVIIFFRADDKVDFRKLVRELSRLLHARIELRQVGPREQGKLCGLIGKCGYPLCCQTFLGQFAQSTIKMAKTQELALNPMKISGVCGRLLCCLNYEQEMYLDAKSRMPRVNKIVDTEYGPGRVVAVNVLKETVTVQLETMTKELTPDQIRPVELQG